MANTIWLFILTALTLLAAAWAHYRLTAHSPNTRWITSAILLITGAAFGWVMAFVYPRASNLETALIFLSAFGLVHVPAAFIMQLKHMKHVVDRDDQ
jgi:drug/metabolite transporter superfamily protein YnfA